MIALVQATSDVVDVRVEEKVLPSALETVEVSSLSRDPKDDLSLNSLRDHLKSKLKVNLSDLTDDEFILHVSSMRFRRSADVQGVILYQEMKTGRMLVMGPFPMKKVEAVSLTVEPCTTHFVTAQKEPFISKSISPQRKAAGV